jgi:hypothetical protein
MLVPLLISILISHVDLGGCTNLPVSKFIFPSFIIVNFFGCTGV